MIKLKRYWKLHIYFKPRTGIIFKQLITHFCLRIKSKPYNHKSTPKRYILLTRKPLSQRAQKNRSQHRRWKTTATKTKKIDNTKYKKSTSIHTHTHQHPGNRAVHLILYSRWTSQSPEWGIIIAPRKAGFNREKLHGIVSGCVFPLIKNVSDGHAERKVRAKAENFRLIDNRRIESSPMTDEGRALSSSPRLFYYISNGLGVCLLCKEG